MDASRKMILVTGFEAFGGERLNPTQILLERLPGSIGGCEIRTKLLPVEFMRAREQAFLEYDRLLPDAVIMLGQAGGRSAVTPESTGKNIMDASIPDNAGYMPKNVPVTENGAETLRSTLDIEKIISAVSACGIPCEQSDDAGKYVCNCLLYGMLDHNRGIVPTGFIHVPYIREQGHEEQPCLELDDLSTGILAAVEAVASQIRN